MQLTHSLVGTGPGGSRDPGRATGPRDPGWTPNGRARRRCSRLAGQTRAELFPPRPQVPTEQLRRVTWIGGAARSDPVLRSNDGNVVRLETAAVRRSIMTKLISFDVCRGKKKKKDLKLLF